MIWRQNLLEFMALVLNTFFESQNFSSASVHRSSMVKVLKIYFRVSWMCTGESDKPQKVSNSITILEHCHNVRFNSLPIINSMVFFSEIGELVTLTRTSLRVIFFSRLASQSHSTFRKKFVFQSQCTPVEQLSYGSLSWKLQYRKHKLSFCDMQY